MICYGRFVNRPYGRRFIFYIIFVVGAGLRARPLALHINRSFREGMEPLPYGRRFIFYQLHRRGESRFARNTLMQMIRYGRFMNRPYSKLFIII